MGDVFGLVFDCVDCFEDDVVYCGGVDFGLCD